MSEISRVALFGKLNEAAYKAVEILRALVKRGAEVQVVLTAAAGRRLRSWLHC